MAKRTRRPSEKVERILQATRALFAAHGFENTSVLQIAEKASVAGGTVIYHFKTKENLLFILTRQILYSLFKSLRASLRETDSATAAIESFVHQYEDYVKQNPLDYLVLLNADPFQILDVKKPEYVDLNIYQSWLVQLVRESLEHGIAEKSITELPVEETSMLIVSMLHCAAKNYLFSDNNRINLYPEVLRFVRSRISVSSTGEVN